MARPPRLMIVEARYYEDIAEELCLGAIAELERSGARWERIAVSGAFELPGAVALALKAGARRAFEGYVALGCVIRGETSHYDLVCTECARGLQSLVLEHGLALGFGVLTCENREQAWSRASRTGGDKGGEAARAALAMLALKRSFARR